MHRYLIVAFLLIVRGGEAASTNLPSARVRAVTVNPTNGVIAYPTNFVSANGLATGTPLYVESDPLSLRLSGGTMAGAIGMGTNDITYARRIGTYCDPVDRQFTVDGFTMTPSIASVGSYPYWMLYASGYGTAGMAWGNAHGRMWTQEMQYPADGPGEYSDIWNAYFFDGSTWTEVYRWQTNLTQNLLGHTMSNAWLMAGIGQPTQFHDVAAGTAAGTTTVTCVLSPTSIVHILRIAATNSATVVKIDFTAPSFKNMVHGWLAVSNGNSRTITYADTWYTASNGCYYTSITPALGVRGEYGVWTEDGVWYRTLTVATNKPAASFAW